MPGFRFAAPIARLSLPVVLSCGGLIPIWPGALNAQTCLVLSPATITADGSALLDLSLFMPPGAAPAAVQWTFQYPSTSISSLTVDDGPMLTSAGKTAICSGSAAAYHCLAVGLNTKSIGNGVIAKVTAVLAPGASTPAIVITDSFGASTSGKAIPIPLRIQTPAGAKVSSDCRLHPPPKGSVGSK